MIVILMLGIFHMRSDCTPLRRTILAGTSLIALAATAMAQDQTTLLRQRVAQSYSTRSSLMAAAVV